MVLPALLVSLAQESPAPAAIDAARGAGRWLEEVAVEVPGGLAWPREPGRDAQPDWTLPDWTLYGGTPGVVLFLHELGAATGEERWTELATAGAGALAAWVARELAETPAGLYTGAAGVAFALGESALRTGDDAHRAAAVEVLEHLHASAIRTEGGARWGEVTDVIAGDAGVGFTLLWSAAALGREEDLELAGAVGRSLLARADERGEGALDWAMSPSTARRMPNFSHGTAGVCTLLSELGRATGDEAFLAGARSGARHLESLAGAGVTFRVHHHEPGGEELFYLGWCHGPPGTVRLFRSLGRAADEPRWRSLERAAHRTLLEAGLPDARPDGYWDNVGVCCGAAGIALALADAPDLEGGRALAAALVRDVVSRGTREGEALSWEHCEHRVRPDLRSVQTGWMQGAAGIGHALLVVERPDAPWRVRLPDEPR